MLQDCLVIVKVISRGKEQLPGLECTLPRADPKTTGKPCSPSTYNYMAPLRNRRPSRLPPTEGQ